MERQGRLRLGISVQRSIQLLPKVLPEFTRLYPKVEFRLHEAGSAYLEQMVQSGQVDLALASVERGQPAAGVPAAPPGAHRDPHRAEQPSGPEISFRGRDPLSEAMDALRDPEVRGTARGSFRSACSWEQGCALWYFWRRILWRPPGRLRSGAAIIWCVQTAICRMGCAFIR